MVIGYCSVHGAKEPLPSASCGMLFQGSYCSNSPVKYALYSGLAVDGSSQGVSEGEETAVSTKIVDTVL
jgi:hypothetical protein